jgi:6-phosphogluconolactonase
MATPATAPRIFDTAEDLAAETARIVAESLRSAQRLRLALAGGTTPKRAYQILAEQDLPWGRLAVLFGDERCVPPDDPESNFRMASETLLQRVAPATVHRMPAELGPEAGAAAYAPVVAAAPIDLVLLGIGPDGHTASLFPGNPALQATGYAVGVRNAPKLPPERVSLTFQALHEARRVLIIVSGADKAEAVQKARNREVPAGLVRNAEWLITRDAGGR